MASRADPDGYLQFPETPLRRRPPVARAHYSAAFVKRTRANETGFVYFVRALGCCQQFIKIGYARHDPYSRLTGLKTNSPFHLEMVVFINGGPTLEKSLHTRFAALKVRGEWFRAEQPLLDFIASLPIKGAAR